jgi:hypothetical protein
VNCSTNRATEGGLILLKTMKYALPIIFSPHNCLLFKFTALINNSSFALKSG